MQLTGECKKEFEKWAKSYFGDLAGDNVDSFRLVNRLHPAIVFDNNSNDVFWYWNTVPYSMQWGVYEEFFDSVGLRIEIVHGMSHWSVYITGENKEFGEIEDYHPDIRFRSEARTKAIEKANELFNNR